jgi:hypothetical protein
MSDPIATNVVEYGKYGVISGAAAWHLTPLLVTHRLR